MIAKLALCNPPDFLDRPSRPAQWHLGKCDDRYEATYRGFDSYQGYLDGAQSYWRHAGDYRNSTSLDSAGETPVCSSAAQVNGFYSASLETAEVARIVESHPKVQQRIYVLSSIAANRRPPRFPPRLGWHPTLRLPRTALGARPQRGPLPDRRRQHNIPRYRRLQPPHLRRYSTTVDLLRRYSTTALQ
jgi:hypothetical protein